MKWPDLVRYALAALMQHKLRTILTVCGVTLGSLLLFTSLSGGLGVIQTVNERLGIGERLLEINVSSGSIVDPVTVDAARKAGFTQEMSDERRVRLAKASGVGGRRNVPLNLGSATELEAMDHVSGVWPEISFRAAMFMAHTTHWTPASVKAIQPTRDLDAFIVAGRSFTSDDAKEVIVGELFLYRLGVQSDDEMLKVIGSKVRFVPNNNSLVQKANLLMALETKIDNDKTQVAQANEDEQEDGQDETVEESFAEQRRKLQDKIDAELSKVDYQTDEFEIVGVTRTPSIEELRFQPRLGNLARNVLMPHRPASEIWKQINPSGRQIRAVVRADKPENVMRLETAIHELGYHTVSLSKLALQIRSAVLLITAIITAIAAAALLISGIGITNTMVMNVMERRREIAIMKSIGAQDADIQSIFLLEGMLIGIIGGVFGLVLGWIFSGLTNDYIRRLLEWRLDEPFGDEIFAYPWWLIIATPLVAAIVTTVASFLPARQAAKVDPVATLRAL